MTQSDHPGNRQNFLQKAGFPKGLLTLTFTRMTINTGYRLVYPFLPVFARGLGISLQTAANIVSLRSLVGILGPTLGSLVDVLDRQKAMRIGMAMAVIGMLSIGLIPTIGGFIAGMLLVAAAKAMFDPSVLAYLGDTVAYEKRGRAIAIAELSWSTASLIGIPAVGLLIALGNWQTPWPVLAGAVILLMILIQTRVQSGSSGRKRQKLASILQSILNEPGLAAAILFTFLICVSNQIIYVVYGAWLEDSFGLSVAQIGAATAVLGAAELLGESGAAAITDRIGKPGAILTGIIVSILGAVSIMVLQSGLAGSLFALFLFYAGFEFALVSLFPLITEMVPAARGTASSIVIAALEIGHALGAVMAPGLYFLGLNRSLIVSIILNLLALAMFQFGIRKASTAIGARVPGE